MTTNITVSRDYLLSLYRRYVVIIVGRDSEIDRNRIELNESQLNYQSSPDHDYSLKLRHIVGTTVTIAANEYQELVSSYIEA